jgi:hypothetical protein
VVYSFGREGEVDRAALERLAKSISRFLSPEQVWKYRSQQRNPLIFNFNRANTLAVFGCLTNYGIS